MADAAGSVPSGEAVGLHGVPIDLRVKHYSPNDWHPYWSCSRNPSGCPNHTAFHNWESQIQTVNIRSQLGSSVHTQKYPANLCEEDEKASFLCRWEGIRADSSQVDECFTMSGECCVFYTVKEQRKTRPDFHPMQISPINHDSLQLITAVSWRDSESCSVRSRFRFLSFCLHRIGKVLGKNKKNIWFKTSKYLKINPPWSRFYPFWSNANFQRGRSDPRFSNADYKWPFFQYFQIRNFIPKLSTGHTYSMTSSLEKAIVVDCYNKSWISSLYDRLVSGSDESLKQTEDTSGEISPQDWEAAVANNSQQSETYAEWMVGMDIQSSQTEQL